VTESAGLPPQHTGKAELHCENENGLAMIGWVVDCAVGVRLVETGHALSQQYPRHAS